MFSQKSVPQVCKERSILRLILSVLSVAWRDLFKITEIRKEAVKQGHLHPHNEQKSVNHSF